MRPAWRASTSSYDIKVGGKKKVQVSANVTNLFDQKAVTGIFGTAYRDRIVLTNENFFKGFNADALAQATNRRPDARYGQPFLFQNPREVRLGLKLMF